MQELCETFGADFLHRNKVMAMQIISGSGMKVIRHAGLDSRMIIEWLTELCCSES